MKIIINAKADPILKEALRLTAQDESTTKTVSVSSLIVDILEKDLRVKEKIKLLMSR